MKVRAGKMKNKNSVLAGHDFGFGTVGEDPIFTQGDAAADLARINGTAITVITGEENCGMEKKKKGCKKCGKEKSAETIIPEKVNSPPHYNIGKIEVIDAIEDWHLGFNDGNAIKYIARHQYKGNSIQDIEKAIWYLQRSLASLKKAEGK